MQSAIYHSPGTGANGNETQLSLAVMYHKHTTGAKEGMEETYKDIVLTFTVTSAAKRKMNPVSVQTLRPNSFLFYSNSKRLRSTILLAKRVKQETSLGELDHFNLLENFNTPATHGGTSTEKVCS